MYLTDWHILGVHWLGWVAAAAGLLFVLFLTTVRLPGARDRQRGEATATLAIHSMLWVFPPGDVARVLVQQPGVLSIQLDLARGLANVVFDPQETSTARLQDFIDNCAHHCRGDRSPAHSCPPRLNGL